MMTNCYQLIGDPSMGLVEQGDLMACLDYNKMQLDSDCAEG